ncbi:MAG: type II toxin-antitoxin system Phd/YefM family antitoxin [bacterium]
MATVTIQEAQASLVDLIHRLKSGEDVLITENDQPVARLVPTSGLPEKKERRFGTLKGLVLSMDQFDDPLEDFREYME